MDFQFTLSHHLCGVTAMLKFQVVEEHGQYMRCVTQPIAVGLAACVCVCTAWVPRQQPSLEQGALSSTAWAAQPPIMDCYLSCIAGAKRGLEISKIHAIMEIHQQHYTVKAKFQSVWMQTLVLLT